MNALREEIFSTIKFKLWKYFVAFGATILIILWLLQTVFLNSFYEVMKQREIVKIGNTLKNEFKSEDFEYTLYNYAIKKGVSITVVNKEGRIIYPVTFWEFLLRPDRIDFEDGELNKSFERVKRGKDYEVSVIKYPRIDSRVIEYIGNLGDKYKDSYYIFISSVLEPVDATTGVLKKILVLVSILSLFVGAILSYFFSKRFSKPLTDMSNTAKALENGNTQVFFKKGSYTEINNLAEALNRATYELKKTNNMRRDLIANVSHDLKTPLTVIKSYGEMIRDISGDNKDMRQEHIGTIIEEADKLTDLVNDLLDLSKLESGMEKLRISENNLGDLAEDVVARFKLQQEQAGYEFKIEKSGDLNICCDQNKISQVIYNLISNAINYSKDEKKILVKISQRENEVEFHVIDKGIGIDEDQLKSIWDRFYRVGDNHQRSSVGTGLGLYIVKSILDLHGFDYGVKSQKDKGSDFYFVARK